MYRVDSVKILINNVHVCERYSIGKKEREGVYLFSSKPWQVCSSRWNGISAQDPDP